MRAFGLIGFDPAFPEPVFKDMEVIFEGLGCMVRINGGREVSSANVDRIV
jgi:hypothetical protein